MGTEETDIPTLRSFRSYHSPSCKRSICYHLVAPGEPDVEGLAGDDMPQPGESILLDGREAVVATVEVQEKTEGLDTQWVLLADQADDAIRVRITLESKKAPDSTKANASRVQAHAPRGSKGCAICHGTFVVHGGNGCRNCAEMGIDVEPDVTEPGSTDAERVVIE